MACDFLRRYVVNYYSAVYKRAASHRTARYELSCLPPAAFYENIASVTVNITRGYPDRAGMRAGFPATRCPHVGIAVPAVISANPYMVPAWPLGAMLHYRSWRAGPYDYLFSIGGANQDAQPQQRAYDDSTHRCFLRFFTCTATAKEKFF